MKRSLLMVLALGGCVAPHRPVSPPAVQTRPAPVPAIVAPPTAWEDRARSLGDWVYQRSDGVSSARFSDPAGQLLFMMSCVGTTGMRFWKPGPEALVLEITTTTASRKFLGSPDALDRGAIGTAAINDPFLDAIIYSRGKFLVHAAADRKDETSPDLILPPWPEIARVVGDCRG